MKPVKYTNGQLSREIEDEDEDWEMTGQEEMNKEYEKCKKQQQKLSVVDIRDKINQVNDLVALCVSFISEAKELDCFQMQKLSSTLHFFVYESLQQIEKDLQEL